MSRLATRLCRLKRQLGGLCPACTKKPARIELVYGEAAARRAESRPAGPCPDCGHEPELICVVLHLGLRPEPAGSAQVAP